MKRVFIKFKDGTHTNIEADFLQIADGIITAWNGNDIVALAKLEFVQTAYLSEKGKE